MFLDFPCILATVIPNTQKGQKHFVFLTPHHFLTKFCQVNSFTKLHKLYQALPTSNKNSIALPFKSRKTTHQVSQFLPITKFYYFFFKGSTEVEPRYKCARSAAKKIRSFTKSNDTKLYQVSNIFTKFCQHTNARGARRKILPSFTKFFHFFQILPSFTKFHQVSPSFTKFYQVSPSFTKFYQVLPSFTKFYQVLPSFTKFYQVLPSFTKFYQVLPSFTKFYQVLPSFTKFHQVSPSFTKFYQVLPSFTSFTQFYQVLPSFTKFYQFLPSFTKFHQVSPSLK